MFKIVATTLLFASFLQICFAAPVTKSKEKESEESDVGGLEDYMEYHRYLKEVVNALESDPDFRKKLEKAEETDIRSGKIAEELEFVSHHVRRRLDEIKRLELNRLNELMEQKRVLQENVDTEDPNHRHLDHSNPHTFEINDLKKLIAKTTEDLAEADQKRREEFKEYELQKEYEKQVKLNQTNGDERAKLEKEIHEREEKHKKHKKLHEPGHKAQLEEVWHEQDEMQQEFDSKTFFMLHDLDSNGLWDQNEVKALFVKELQKMYEAGGTEEYMRERAEEMERMRESVFEEFDLNKDGFIDYQEFLAQTKRADFQEDHGWKGLDETKPFTDEEWQDYLQKHGPPVGYPQVPPGGYYPPNPQFHPGQQVPQQHPQQLPGHLPDLNSNDINHQQQQLPPQANYHQNQVQGNFQPQGNNQQQHPPPQYQGGYQQLPPQQNPQGYQQPPPQYQQAQGNYPQPPQQVNQPLPPQPNAHPGIQNQQPQVQQQGNLNPPPVNNQQQGNPQSNHV